MQDGGSSWSADPGKRKSADEAFGLKNDATSPEAEMAPGLCIHRDVIIHPVQLDIFAMHRAGCVKQPFPFSLWLLGSLQKKEPKKTTKRAK